jgi:hypothetical protein
MQELRNLVEETANKNNSKLDVKELVKEISNFIVNNNNTTSFSSSNLLNNRKEENLNIEQRHQLLAEEQWQQLQVSLSSIRDMMKKQQITFQDQHQKVLEVLIAREKKLDFAGESEQVHFFASEREVEQLLNHNQKYFTNIILASSVLVPIFTWALCKFV